MYTRYMIHEYILGEEWGTSHSKYSHIYPSRHVNLQSWEALIFNSQDLKRYYRSTYCFRWSIDIIVEIINTNLYSRLESIMYCSYNCVFLEQGCAEHVS